MTIQMKATERRLHIVLSIVLYYKKMVAASLGSAEKTLACLNLTNTLSTSTLMWFCLILNKLKTDD